MKEKKAKPAGVGARGRRPGSGRKTSKWPIYKTLAECSRETGISSAHLQEMRRLGCPAISGKIVHLGKLMPWLAAKKLSTIDAESGEENLSHRAALDKWRAAREKIRLDKDMESVIPKAEVREGLQAVMGILFSFLERVFCNELPPVLKGLDERSMSLRCKKETEDLKGQLRNKFSEFAGKVNGDQEDLGDLNDEESETSEDESQRD